MDKLNLGFLVSSVLATAGLGIYAYMNYTDNHNDSPNDNQLENVKNEYSNDAEEEDNDKYIKSNKKSVSIKTKRRNNKSTGTRRKR
jgi:hypothetical protein